MKQKLLAFITALVLVSGTAFAKSLVLTLSNGKKVYYLLDNKTTTMMRFVDGKITVEADEYTFSNIKNFYISEQDDPNSIEEVISKSNATYRANTLVVNTVNTPVKVYTTNGMEVNAETSNTGSTTSVDLNNLAKGTYIIRIGDSSFKVMKK
jgi:hypothetical protein